MQPLLCLRFLQVKIFKMPRYHHVGGREEKHGQQESLPRAPVRVGEGSETGSQM